jgi:hypothetical protein
MSSRARANHAVLISTSLAVMATFVVAVPAFAYRPFDGSDAAVADLDEVEIEFQPAGRLREGAERSLIAPATVINYGFAKNWELGIEGKLTTPLSFAGPTALTDAAVRLKYVLKPGSLQDQAGPSIATEFGILAPDSNGASGVGASWAGIVSQRWEWGTVHYNVQAMLTRDHHADLFVGTIVEGPASWKVRPVAEIFYENEIGEAQTVSGLLGLIWQVNDKLAFDVGIRAARKNGQTVGEIRAGLTVGFDLAPRLSAPHQ